jgi:RNA 3'-terminal phosphate cyclase (ATP)
MGDSVIIDGSHGVGGGQILRTALTLSAITGRLLAIQRLRAGRPKPGLAAQHLTAVLSAAELCRAAVSGATLGSETLSFRPTAWVIGQFGIADVLIEGREGGPARVSVRPKAAAAGAHGRPV